MSTMHTEDDRAREIIREAIDRNIFAEAGAGSGKTFMLVERMIAMVKSGLDISRICAITFTKAAANEFYERFRNRLSEEAEHGDERAAEALKDIDLCFMGTIDAFCHMILTEHPVKAGIPIGAAVVTEEERLQEYRSWFIKAIRGELGTERKQQAVRISRYFRNPAEAYAYMMKVLMEMRNSEIHYAPPAEKSIEEAFCAEKEELLNLLRYLQEHQSAAMYNKPKKDGSLTERDQLWQVLPHALRKLSANWERNLDDVEYTIKSISQEKKGLRINPEFYEFISKNERKYPDCFTPNVTAKGKTTWWNLHTGDLLQKLENQKFSALIDFAAKTKDMVSEDLRARGKLSYFDNLFYLRNLLRKDAAEGGQLIRHIYERHSYFLIDEFQDTNPIQAEIFFYLTSETPETDWRACRPRQGSLFIVGDPKQSIYRFRGADVESYLNVKELFRKGGGEVVELTRNYRSTDEICAWFNKVFTRLLPDETKMQSKFSPIPLTGEPGAGSLDGAFSFDPEKTSEIGIIERLVQNPEITIRTLDENKNVIVRPLNYGDFMLITFSKKELSRFIEQLKEKRIPFMVEGNTLFGECELLKCLSVIFSAVADPDDDAARFEAVHLTRCGLDEKTLEGYSGKAKGMSPSAVLSFLLDEPWRAKVSTEYMEYAYYALELLRAKELDGTVDSLKSAAAYLRSLIHGDEEIERCLQFDSEVPAVHLANLHKVKGLEKPVVILNERGIFTPKASQCVDYETTPPQSYVFSVEKDYAALTRSSDYSEAAEQECERLEEEGLRQLYVAATRAANALIMPKVGEKEGFWSRLAAFASGNAIEDFMEEHHAKAASADGAPHEKMGELLDLSRQDGGISTQLKKNRTYEKKTPSTMDKVKSEKEQDQTETDTKPPERTTNKGRADVMGTLVHAYMERLVLSKGRADDDEIIRALIVEYEKKLSEGVDYHKILKAVADTIRSGGYPKQEPDVPEDILTELLAADEVHCELPFCYREEPDEDTSGGAVLWNGVIDVAYKKDGQWHILDYKTNYENDALGEKYQQQLARYVQAFEAITGHKADARIYSIPV